MIDCEKVVQEFLEEDHQPGVIISERWKLEKFGLQKPAIGSMQQFKQFQLNLLGAFKRFEGILLENHQIHLRPCKNGAHVVIHPDEQTSTAWNDGMHEVSKALRKTKVRLVNVDTVSISRELQKENTDCQARLAQVSSMFKKARKV